MVDTANDFCIGQKTTPTIPSWSIEMEHRETARCSIGVVLALVASKAVSSEAESIGATIQRFRRVTASNWARHGVEIGAAVARQRRGATPA